MLSRIHVPAGFGPGHRLLLSYAGVRLLLLCSPCVTMEHPTRSSLGCLVPFFVLNRSALSALVVSRMNSFKVWPNSVSHQERLTVCGRHLWLANIHLDSAVLLLSSWLHLPRLTLSVPMPKRRSADAGGTTWVPPSRRPRPTSHRLCAPSGSGASGTTPSDSVWQARRGKSAPPRSLPSAAA